jgi:uncharacterized protein
MITLYIDADACPVKQEIYRVAERHARKGVALKVFVVSNSPIAVPRIFVGARPDAKPDATFAGRARVVSNSPIAIPRDGVFGGPPDAKPGATFAGSPLIERVVVGSGMDEADNWIAERAGAGDIVITADVPLASRSIKAGAQVIAPNGRAFTKDSIGMTLSTRNLMDSLRSAGAITGGPKPFAPRDRSAFLAALDQAIVRLVRAGHGRQA